MKRLVLTPAAYLRDLWDLKPGELGDAWVAWDMIGTFLAFIAAVVWSFFK